MWDEKINICYGISDKKGNYAKVVGTSICSLLENCDAPLKINIIHDETMIEENRKKFQNLIEGYGQEVCFYDVSKKWKNTLEVMEKSIQAITGTRFNIGAVLRLFMGDVLKQEKRIIYLDADIIVNMNIRELWESDIPDSGLAAVSDIPIQQTHITKTIKSGMVIREEYFNSGVLLIDLEKFRSIDGILNKCAGFITAYKPEYMDQDFLNCYFPHSAVLPEKYNCFVYRGRQKGGPEFGYMYHFANNCAGLDMDDDFNRLYCKYFAKTPWCNESFIGNLAKKINDTNYGYLNYANKCAGRRRIVIGNNSGKEIISNMLGFHGDDLYVAFEDIEKFQLNFKKSKDVFLIFLVGSDYKKVVDSLTSLGLLENQHFFDMCGMLGWLKSNNLGYDLFIDC